MFVPAFLATLAILAAAAGSAAASEEGQDLGWLAGDSCLSMVSLATVSTDQDDYAPGSAVNVSGSGFGANCAYELRVIRPDGVVETFDVLSGAEGELSHSFILPPPPGVIGDYRIDVADAAGEVVATWWFTDNIAFANHAANNTGPGGAATLSIGKPTSTTTGDFLIAQVSVGGLNSGEPICAPSGWTSIRRDTRGSDVSTNTFWKFAGAADASVTNYQFFARSSSCTSGSNLSRRMSGGILRYTGVDTATPVEASNGTNGASSATLTAPAVTASAGARVIGFYGIKKNTLISPHPADGMAVPPDGSTAPRYSVFVNDGSGPASMAADLIQSSAGSTGTKRATVPSANAEVWVAQLVSLKAAPTPTKLAFTTPARTGAVGQCLGPITVQAQNASSAPTNVSIATQVNLATNGSGSFYTGSTCGGSSVSSVTIANGTSSATFYYKAAAFGTGSHELTASATGLTSASQTQTITNPAPVLTAPDDQTAGEGSEGTFDLGSFSDADDPGPWTVEVDWGDGSGTDSFQVNDDGDIQRSHTYADNGSYTLEVTVIDGSDQSDSEAFEVTVDNVAPTLTGAEDQEADEGSSTAFALGSFSDPGVEDSPWTVTVDWGDGSGPESSDVTEQGDIGGSHTYDDNGVYTVSVTVTDKDGESSAEESFEVTVANVASSATFANDGPVNEGSSFTISLSDPSDPSAADTTAGFEYAFDCGDGDGYGDFGAAASRSCPTSDDGSRSVGAKIRDKDGGEREYTDTVTVNNVAPVVTAPDDQGADEGASAEFELGSFTDPGVDGPWQVTVDWGDGAPATTFTESAPGPITAKSHTYADDGTYEVSVTVGEAGDGETPSDTKTFEIEVANVAPAVTAPDDQTADEGAGTELALGSFTDPGADGPWSVTVDWGDGSPATTFTEAAPGPITAQSHTYDDNGPYTVTVTVAEAGDGAPPSDAKTFEVTVANVAPSATFAQDGPVDEGSSFELTLSDPSDPSAADTTAGFEYAFDCGDGDGYGDFGAAASRSCPTSDDGSRSVGAKIRDKDGGEREYTDTVTVNNVAPTLTGADDQESDEGESKSFDLGSFSDPGADSPWTVTVDWGDASTAETFNANATGAIGRSHTYADNGTYTVSVTVTDKDDGASTTETFEVTVGNVAPTITSFTGTDYLHGPLAFTGGGTANSVFTTVFSDPGTLDTHSAYFEYSDGSPLTETVSPFVSGQTVKHRFASAGCDKSASVKVTDDDGDYDTAQTTVDVGTGTFLPPMTNQPVTDKLKNGQVLPVKIRVAGCDGLGLTTLSPTIKLIAGDQTAVAESSSALIDPTSVSAADTTGVMRHSSNGDYIYNMKVQLPLNTKYTVVIYPFGGTSGPRLAHLIEATK